MEEQLPSHQSESGLVTTGEVRLAKRWVTAIAAERQATKTPACIDGWLATDLPFTFTYGGKSSASFLNQWKREALAEPASAGVAAKEGEDGQGPAAAVSASQQIVWTDPATGLRVSWELKRFLEFPAVEWLPRFENTGTPNTPIIENVQALDLRLKRSGDEPFLVHAAVGGKAAMDDFMPFYCLVPHTRSYPELTTVELGGDWPSSARHLPFYNIETPQDRGVMVGVGWSGIWLARTKIEGTSLRTCAGQKNMHLSLHPGESIRSPRLLLLFWEGKRLHGHNMLRQLLHRHYVPPLFGEPQQEPRVVTNAAFARKFAPMGTVNLAKGTEADVRPLVKPFIKLGAEVFIIDAGWYKTDVWSKNMGDWEIDRHKYPRGFVPIAKPLTPYALDALWLGYQFHRADLDRGVALVFHRPMAKGAVTPDTETLVCSLRGIDPGQRYLVRSERKQKAKILTGKQLAKGLTVTIPERRGAEMLVYEPAV